MRAATAIQPNLRLLALSQEAAAQLFKLAGLSIAVGIPVLFWTAALALASHAVGFQIGVWGLAYCALTVTALCSPGASLVMTASARGR